MKYTRYFWIFEKILILTKLWTIHREEMHFNDTFIWKCRFSNRTWEYFMGTKRQNDSRRYFWIFGEILYFNRVMAKKNLEKIHFIDNFVWKCRFYKPDFRNNFENTRYFWITQNMRLIVYNNLFIYSYCLKEFLICR